MGAKIKKKSDLSVLQIYKWFVSCNGFKASIQASVSRQPTGVIKILKKPGPNRQIKRKPVLNQWENNWVTFIFERKKSSHQPWNCCCCCWCCCWGRSLALINSFCSCVSFLSSTMLFLTTSLLVSCLILVSITSGFGVELGSGSGVGGVVKGLGSITARSVCSLNRSTPFAIGMSRAEKSGRVSS